MEYTTEVNWIISKAKYDWASWIADLPSPEHAIVLERGVDFDSTFAAIEQSARNFADSNGYKLSTRKLDDKKKAFRFTAPSFEIVGNTSE